MAPIIISAHLEQLHVDAAAAALVLRQRERREVDLDAPGLAQARPDAFELVLAIRGSNAI